MKLGTRWGFGSAPPTAVPIGIHAAISEAEAAAGPAGEGSSWTLTWLEGRPIATLDDGTTVTIDGGIPRISTVDGEDDPDAW